MRTRAAFVPLFMTWFLSQNLWNNKTLVSLSAAVYESPFFYLHLAMLYDVYIFGAYNVFYVFISMILCLYLFLLLFLSYSLCAATLFSFFTKPAFSRMVSPCKPGLD